MNNSNTAKRNTEVAIPNVTVSPELLSTIAEIASNAAIEYYKDEQEKADKRRKYELIENVKRMLKAYRGIKNEIEDQKEFTEEEKSEYRWKFIQDLMGNSKSYVSKSERIIQDEEKRRQENLYTLYRIENAMRLYKKECEMSSVEENKRRYREVYALHMADDCMTIQELAEKENVCEKTVKRDLATAYKMIAFYIYGKEALE